MQEYFLKVTSTLIWDVILKWHTMSFSVSKNLSVDLKDSSRDGSNRNVWLNVCLLSVSVFTQIHGSFKWADLKSFCMYKWFRQRRYCLTILEVTGFEQSSLWTHLPCWEQLELGAGWDCSFHDIHHNRLGLASYIRNHVMGWVRASFIVRIFWFSSEFFCLFALL